MSEKGSVVVKTIDGRPASETWLSWLPEKDAAPLQPWVDDYDGQDPLSGAPAWAACGMNPMGIQRSRWRRHGLRRGHPRRRDRVPPGR